MTRTETPPAAPAVTSLLDARFVVVIAAQFCIILAMGAVNIALPVIQADLGAGDATIQWLVALYQLGFALVLVLGGRLGDLYGTVRLFRLGFVGFLVASVLATVAPTASLLLAARFAQGIAGGIAAPQVLALIQRLYLGDRRTRAFAVYTMVSAGGYLLGQFTTGALIGLDPLGLGWRWGFAFGIPLGVAVLIASMKFLRPRPPGGRAGIDVVGVVLLGAMSLLVLVPLIQGRSVGWPWWIFAMLVAAAPMMLIFIQHERRVTRSGGDPLIELDLFDIRTFAVGNGLGILIGLMSFSLVVYVTLTLQFGFDRSPLETAFATAPIPFANIFGSVAGAAALRRWGRGAFAIAAGLIALSVVVLAAVLEFGPQPTKIVHLVPGLLLLGFALGVALASTVAVTLGEISEQQAGGASGVQQTVQQLTSAVGIALFGIVFYGSLGDDPTRDDYAGALTGTLLLALVLCALLGAAHRLLPAQVSGRPSAVVVVEPEDVVFPLADHDSE